MEDLRCQVGERGWGRGPGGDLFLILVCSSKSYSASDGYDVYDSCA
jgi:hypothetical protein